MVTLGLLAAFSGDELFLAPSMRSPVLAPMAALVFIHPVQRHFSEHAVPALKHSQYRFRQADLVHPHPMLCTLAFV